MAISFDDFAPTKGVTPKDIPAGAQPQAGKIPPTDVDVGVPPLLSRTPAKPDIEHGGPITFKSFAPTKTPAAESRTLHTLKALGGETAAFGDFLYNLAVMPIGVAADIEGRAAALLHGEDRKIQAKVGRAMSERAQELYGSPIHKFLDLFDSGQAYEASKTVKGMNWLTDKVNDFANYVEKKSKGAILKEDVQSYVDTLMTATAFRGGAIGIRKVTRAGKEPAARSSEISRAEPVSEARPAAREARPVSAPPPRTAPPPSLAKQRSGVADPLTMGWVATGLTSTAVGVGFYENYKKYGTPFPGRDAKPLDKYEPGEPLPTEKGTYLSGMKPGDIKGLASIIPVAGMIGAAALGLPERMPTELAWGMKDVDRTAKPGSTDLAELTKSVQKEGVKKPITITVDRKQGLAYVTDGNNRLAAARAAGIRDIPVKWEHTDVPFTEEQMAKATPIRQLGLGPEHFPEKKLTAQQIADRDELRRLLGEEVSSAAPIAAEAPKDSPFIGYISKEGKTEFYPEEDMKRVDYHHSNLVKDMPTYDEDSTLRFVRMGSKNEFTIAGDASLDPFENRQNAAQLTDLANKLIKSGADPKAPFKVAEMGFPFEEAPYQGKSIGTLGEWAEGRPRPPRGGRQAGFMTTDQAAKLTAIGIGAAAGAYLNQNSPYFGAAVAAGAVLAALAFKENPILKREIKQSVEQIMRNVAPEALGKEAKDAAAIVAKNVSISMQKESAIYHGSQGRIRYWNKAGDASKLKFISRFERGWSTKDPTLKAIVDFYHEWNKSIYERDSKLGIKYDPRDNYLYHVFQNPEELDSYFTKKYGPKWGDPKFTKERSLDLYDEAMAIKNPDGSPKFVPLTTNPEEIMLMRQHASDVAEMRIQALRDMQTFGLAKRVEKGISPEAGDVQWRAPNGERYWVSKGAAQILHNAFDTPSLWNMKGIVGTTFRGAMFLKNSLVPIKLTLSLFHPLHILTIDNYTAMVRATKELAGGSISPAEWATRMGRSVNPLTATYDSIWKNPRAGWRVIQAWRGIEPKGGFTASDQLSLQYMHEGGFTPEMSAQYRTKAAENFRAAVQRGSISAAFKLPFAMVQWLQKPIFEVWIPALKTASYLHDVQAAVRADPTLVDDPMRRMTTFRRLAKSVDNRYGEMSYSTLFWNRMIKDIGVASTLSLGWNLGFLREYGGALGDIGQATLKRDVRGRIIRGELDRPMFVGFYTAGSLLYGGLLTWALTGQLPASLADYVYPRTGDKNRSGQDARVTTMFYSREIAGIYKHMQNEGIVSGLGQLAENKLVPLAGEVHTWATNTDYFGREISDPNSPLFQQLEQKLTWTLSDLTPISIQALSRGPGSTKARILSIAGFSPAPHYATESPAESQIVSTFRKYHKTVTPFERAAYGADVGELYHYRQNNQPDEFQRKMDEIKDKYHLTYAQVRRLQRESKIPTSQRMFRSLTEDQQRRIIKDMAPEERQQFLPYARKALQREYRQ